MIFIKKKIFIRSLLVSLAVLVCLSVGIYFIIREYWEDDGEKPEICIKTRCMPQGYRKSDSNFICSPEKCAITAFNDSEIDQTCVAMECITRGDKDKFLKVNSSVLCLDTICFRDSAVYHLKPGGVCSSKDCFLSACQVVKTMDHNIKPCDNFYNFSCNGFFKKKRSEDGSTSIGEDLLWKVLNDVNEILRNPIHVNDSEALERAKTVYQLCSDEGSKNVRDSWFITDVLSKSNIGTWPFLEAFHKTRRSKAEGSIDVEWRTAMLLVYGVDTFFRFNVGFNEDSLAFINMTVAPPLLKTSCSEELSDQDKDYIQMLNKIMEHVLHSDSNLAEKAVAEIINFDREYCVASRKRSLTSKEEESFQHRTNITLEELSDIAPSFNWKRWHNIIVSGLDMDGRMKNAPLYTSDLHLYIRNIIQLLNDARPSIIANYLSTKFLLTYVGFLDRPFLAILKDHSLLLKDYTSHPMYPVGSMTRKKQCAKYLERVMGMAIIPSFVSQKITKSVEREMEYLAELVERSFKETFHHSAILSNKERVEIAKTITKFDVFLLYPDENATFFDEYYSDMGPLRDSFLESGMQVTLFHQRKVFEAVYGKSHDYDLELKVLLQNPFESHAFAAITENKTVIFIGSTHVTGVKLNVPRYINFATLGTTIALEYVIGSHLLSDSPGKDTFDAKAKEWKSWPEDIREHVKEKNRCYEEKYASELEENAGFNIKDMMANVQALKESLQAYRMYCERYGHEPLLQTPVQKYNDEQLFFILYAQSFCSMNSYQDGNQIKFSFPDAERVNEVLKNLNDFADAFHCDSDSPMNPSDKCGTVW